MSEPTYRRGETRRSKSGATWTIIREMPHVNGDPAYVRASSERGPSRTFHCAEWAVMEPVCGPLDTSTEPR